MEATGKKCFRKDEWSTMVNAMETVHLKSRKSICPIELCSLTNLESNNQASEIEQKSAIIGNYFILKK